VLLSVARKAVAADTMAAVAWVPLDVELVSLALEVAEALVVALSEVLVAVDPV
jgi:hypothetical protein